MEADDMESAMLREAIAASLRDQDRRKSSPRTQRGVVDLTRDSDDDSDVCEVIPKSKSVVGSDTDEEAEDDGVDKELEQAIQLSLGSGPDDDQVTKKDPVTPIESPQKFNPSPSAFLGLNRKQMEEERLARVAKRKAETSASPQQKAPKLEVTPPHQLRPVAPRTPVQQSAPDLPALICHGHAANDPNFPVQPIARPVPQWPLGAVKKTCVSNQPRKGDDITLEEVFQRGDLELAVLSSFLWDMDWVFDKLDMQKTRLYLVMHAKEEDTVSIVPERPNPRIC